MTVRTRQLRDYIAALIALIDEAIYGSMPEPQLSEALDGLDQSWVGELDSTALPKLLGSMPGRSTDDSGLSLLARCLVGPEQEFDPRIAESLRGLAAALETRQIELMPLFLALEGEPVPSRLDAADRFAAIAVRGGWITSSLGLSDDEQADPWFRRLDWAVDATVIAQNAVAELLQEFPDVPDLGAPLDLTYGVWPPHVRGADRTISLGVALDLLAGITGLPAEHRGSERQFLGQLTDGGQVLPMSRDELLGRAKALEAVARQVIGVTSSGWYCVSSVEEGGQAFEALAPAPATLDEAACLLWGDTWQDWKRRHHRAALRRLGWIQVDHEEPLEVPYCVRPSQVVQLEQHFLDSSAPSVNKEEGEPDDKLATVPPQRVAVLGGGAGSGKSVIASLVARELNQRKRPWDVRIISCIDRELPDRHKAVEAARRAFLSGVTTPGRPRLLVLDDILPIGSGAVTDVLLHLARTADCRVLCCLQYDAHSETSWDTDGVTVFPAIVGEAALRDFVEQLTRQYEQLDVRRGHGELTDMAGLDLRRLIRLMERDHDEELRSELCDLHGEARTYVLRAAAACLIRGAASGVPTGEPNDEAPRSFDITCPPDGYPCMVSPGDSRRVLEWAIQDRRADENGQGAPEAQSFADLCQFVVELAAPQFAELFKSGAPGVVGRLLCARLYHPRICADLLEQARLSGNLEHWAAKQPATHLAQFLLGLRRTLDADSREVVEQAFSDRLLFDGTPLPLNDLMLVVRCLRLQLPGLQNRLTLLLDWLHAQVTRLLNERSSGRRVGSADQCLQLMRLIGTFHDAQLNALVTERIVDILGDLDPQRAADYYLVPQVIRVQTRAARNVGDEEVSKHPVFMEPDIRSMWDCEPPSRATLPVHMGRIMLRNIVHPARWDSTVLEVQEYLPNALRLTAVPDLIALFTEMRRVSMHSNEILQWAANSKSRDTTSYGADFMRTMRDKLRQATAIEAAQLLHLVYSLHARAASRLICVSDGVPDRDLAKSLASKARSDAKGAGMLLSAAGYVDDLYLREAPAFATLIGEELGQTWVIDRLRKDMRPSVKYHLVKGVWAAEVSFREECRQAVLDVTATALREALRPWGPRFAMMIGTDPFFGSSFLAELRQRVDVNDILRGMSIWSSAEVQVEYHRLGRAMFPDLISLFSPEFDLERTAQRLMGSSAVSAAECTRELHRTLRRPGGAYDGDALILATNQTPGRDQVWADRLYEIEGGYEFAQIVNVLADVDGARTRTIVRDEFGKREVTRPGAGGAEPIIHNMARHMMYDSVGGGSAMLAALEQHAGIGNATYRYLREDDRLMRVFKGELSWIQNPAEQYAAAVNLTRAGVYPDQPYTQWMNVAYNLKLGLVSKYTSPSALLAVLRMMLLWKREWARDIAGRINYDLVARRLSQGRMTDLTAAVQLAAALFVVDEIGGSWSIVDVLHGLGVRDVIEATGLADGVTLLSLASELKHPASVDAARGVNTAVVRGLGQGIVFDDHALWTDIGQACHTLAMKSFEVSAAVLQPARRLFQLDVPTLLWGLQRLRSSPWRDETYDSSLRRLLGGPPVDPAGMLTGLAAAAAAGRLFEVSADDLRNATLRAPFRTVANLCEVAETSPALDLLLRPLRDDLALRTEEREAWGSWHAKRLSRSLARQAWSFPATG